MKLPTMSELIGLDKFQLTESQNQQCRMLAYNRSFEAAIEQAKIFELKNKTQNTDDTQNFIHRN